MCDVFTCLKNSSQLESLKQEANDSSKKIKDLDTKYIAENMKIKNLGEWKRKTVNKKLEAPINFFKFSRGGDISG